MPFVPPGGSGGGSKKRAAPDPKKELVRALGKAMRTGAPNEQLSRSLEGMRPGQIRRAGAEVGLTPRQTQQLTGLARTGLRAPDQTYAPLVMRALDVLDRPAQAVKGGIVESSGLSPVELVQGKGLVGAWHGLTGQEHYSGSETAGAVATRSEEGGKKFSKSLPGPVRFGVDVAVDTGVDPLNYFTFGVGGLADDAARSAAKLSVGQAAKEAVLSPEARDAYQSILAKGLKGLDEQRRRALEAAFPKGKIPRELRMKINRAQGGVRFAGLQVPGTRGWGRNWGPKARGVGSSTEKFLRPDAAIRQLERADEVLPGVAKDVTNTQAQAEGARWLAGLAGKRAERGAEEAAGRALRGVEKVGQRRSIKAGRKLLNDPESLRRILASLDVGGGRAAREALPVGEREAADFLRRMADEDFAALVREGRLQSDEALAAGRASKAGMSPVVATAPGPVSQDQYLYHLRETAPSSGRASGSAGFLRRRTNQEPILDAEGYVQDPVRSMAVHQAGTTKEVAQVQAWRELESIPAAEGKGLVIRGDDAVRGMSPKIDEFKAANPNWADEYVELSTPQLEGAVRPGQKALVRKEIAPFYERFAKATTDRSFMDAVRYTSALWAGYAVATPGFIARNVLQGNLMMAWMADGLNPKVWAESLGTMKRMQRGISRLGDPYVFLKPEERDLIEGAIRNNAVETNFMDSLRDQARTFAEAGTSRSRHWLKTGKASPLSTKFAPINLVRSANQWAEGWSRLGVYATKIRQGYSAPEAASVARKYMLDYKNLSPANDALRVINPFLTWTYKAAPLVMGEALRDPRKIRIPQTILNALGDWGDDEGPTSEWMAEAGGVQLPGTNQVFLPATPIETANETLAPALTLGQVAAGDRPAGTGLSKAALEAINVLGNGGASGSALKTLWETATGTKSFTGQKMAPGSRAPNPIPFVGGSVPWEVANAAHNFLPGLSTVDALFPQTDYDRNAQKRRLIGKLTGGTFFPNDKRAKDAELWRRIAEWRAWQASEAAKGNKPPELRGSSGASPGGFRPPGG